MKLHLRALPQITINTKFASEREWLDHLRILAELPYPSLALMPSILPVMRCRVSATFGGFGWTTGDLDLLAFMTEHMNEQAYRWWMGNRGTVLQLFPVRSQLESGGNVVRHACSAPGFDETDFCREILVSQNLRWMALAPVRITGSNGYGFLSMYRTRELNPFTDGEQALLARGAAALASLDGPDNPLASLPSCALVEAEEATVAIRADGNMAARSQEAMRLIYLLGGAAMFTMEWARPDWFALPDQVRETTQALFSVPNREAKRRIRIEQPWGRFDFVIEKMPDRQVPGESIALIGIRYHEPVDITVARRLAGWPLSPREKRILVAATRSTNLAELAGVLGITVNTLKSYNKELVDRLDIESRQRLIELLLGDEAAEHDLRNRSWPAAERPI